MLAAFLSQLCFEICTRHPVSEFCQNAGPAVSLLHTQEVLGVLCPSAMSCHVQAESFRCRLRRSADSRPILQSTASVGDGKGPPPDRRAYSARRPCGHLWTHTWLIPSTDEGEAAAGLCREPGRPCEAELRPKRYMLLVKVPSTRNPTLDAKHQEA